MKTQRGFRPLEGAETVGNAERMLKRLRYHVASGDQDKPETEYVRRLKAEVERRDREGWPREADPLAPGDLVQGSTRRKK